MSTDNSVCIAGAGLMGSLLAWRLARAGFRVRVYEAATEQQPASAAYTAAAMVAPWAERSACHETVFHSGLLSLQLWPRLLQELEQDSGIHVHYGQQGSLILAHPADQAEMQQFRRELQHYGLWQGNAGEQVQPLEGAALRQLEPGINQQLNDGIWLHDEIHIDNRALLPALHQAARQLGAEFYFQSSLQDFPAAGLCLDCRGLGAQQDWPQLRGVRGEVLWIETPDVQIQRPLRLLHPRYHLYLVPKGQVNGTYRYILGATEIESEDRSAVSVRSALEMLSALYCLSPALAEARILSFDVNLRPALPDHQPRIQPFAVNGLQVTGKQMNGLRINGLFRHGYLLAPAMLWRLQQDHQLTLGLTSGLVKGGQQGEAICV